MPSPQLVIPQGLRILCVAFLLGAAADASAATDALFVAPLHEAPAYDSDHGAEARLRGLGTAPEADARPGEYYFLLGAEAFRKHDYEHAVEMYQVAASWAYKPAEYNLGVMYARGQGVAVDLPRAMAWLALAAERNEPHYVDAREAVYAEMSKEQFEQANVLWRDMKKTYGDEVALRRAKARWAEVRSHMTGSRVGSVGNLSVGLPNANDGDPSNQKGDRAGANVHTYAGTSAEVTGGNGIDGSIAYRQLLESDNPYDPKFDRGAIGRATVGPLEQVDAPGAKKKEADASQPDQH